MQAHPPATPHTLIVLHDLLAANAHAHGERIAVVDGAREVNYAELHDAAEALAGALHEAGVTRGTRVAVHLPKSVEEIVGIFAVARLGAVCVIVNRQWSVHQLAHVLADSGARALISDVRATRALIEHGLPDGLHRIVVQGEPPAHERCIAWPRQPATGLPPLPVLDVDLAALLYTSGSTGLPKGVMLTHVNLLAGARAVARYVENRADDRLLSLLPLSFDAGLSQLTCAFLVGARLVLQKVSMPAEIVRTLIEQRITGMAAVPPVWIQLARYLDAAPTPFPELRYLTNTGGAIPQTTLERLPVHFPDVRIYLMYGLTEAFRSTYLPPARYQLKRGAIGQAIPNVECFVIHGDGRPCEADEEGELLHRGSLVSRGYWNKPEETAAKIRPCAALADRLGAEPVAWSGDVIRVDADGDYWFVGRRDGLIKVSGFRISPEEVEDIVYRSGQVGHVVAFGAPDELNGQAVEIAVTALDGATMDEATLLRYCRAEMPHYMVPRRIHLWAGELPRTSSGKLDRPAIVHAALAPTQESEDGPRP